MRYFEWFSLSSIYQKVKRPALAIALGLIAGVLLFWWGGANPIQGYAVMFGSTLGDVNGLVDTILVFIPLALVSLGLVVCFKAGFWNIGGEGQFLMASVIVVILGNEQGIGGIYADWPLLIILGLAGFAVAAGWCLVPALLKAKLGVNEVITTMMFNFMAYGVINYLVSGPFRMWYYNGTPTGHPMTYPVLVKLPIISGQLNIGIFVVFVMMAIVYWLLYKSKLGYKLRAVGLNTKASSYFGIDAPKVTIISVIIGAGIIGLAGMIDMTGLQTKFVRGFSPNFGFEGILIALISGANPFGAVAMSFFLAILKVGGTRMYSTLGVPVSVFLADAVLSLMLLFMVLFVYIPSFKEVFTKFKEIVKTRLFRRQLNGSGADD